MKGVKRWTVFLGVSALALVLLVLLARALDIDPVVWIAQKIGRETEARRVADREAGQREFQERWAKEREEATRGVPYWMNGHRLSRKGSEFQIAVKGDEVGFYRPQPAVLPPPEVWFIDLTMEYDVSQDYQGPVDTARRLRIDESNVEPFRIERGKHPHEDELILPSVTYPDGRVVRFHCLASSVSSDEFRAALNVEDLAKIPDGLSCRTFLYPRGGIRLMVQFPIRKADIAHRAVTQAIALMDRSIVDQPPLEN